jgi:hypothetical protein
MRPIINARRAKIVLPSTVGSIAQATRNAQAVRDARR